MGLKSKESKMYVVGYDCGVKDMEVTEIVCSPSFEKAIHYAEKSAEELYEDLELFPHPLEFDGTEEEYADFKQECSLYAIGFWAREFDEEKDQDLIQSLGVIEITK